MCEDYPDPDETDRCNDELLRDAARRLLDIFEDDSLEREEKEDELCEIFEEVLCTIR
jgi:hypothetical protein